MFEQITRSMLGLFVLWLPACERPAPIQPSSPPASSQVAEPRTVTKVEAAVPHEVSHQPVELAGDDDASALAELEHAESLLVTFLKKAGDDPAYRQGVERARQRLQDIRDTIAWLKQGLELKMGKPPAAPLGSNAR